MYTQLRIASLWGLFTDTNKDEQEVSGGLSHLLVEFEPRDVTFTVRVLQAKEPDLPQTHRLHHLE